MDGRNRASQRGRPIEIGFFVIVLAISAGVHRGAHWPSVTAAQAILLMAAMASVLSSKAVAVRLFGAGRRYSLVGVSLLAALIVGHLRDNPHQTFPFIGWPMYGLPPREHEVVFYDYTVVLADGSSVQVRPAEVLEVFGGRATVRLEHLANAIAESGDPERSAPLIANYDAILRAVAHRYGRQHPGPPPRTVEVARNVVPRLGYCGPSCVTRAPSHTVAVGAE